MIGVLVRVAWGVTAGLFNSNLRAMSVPVLFKGPLYFEGCAF